MASETADRRETPAKTPSAAARVGATPTPDGPKTGLDAGDPAIRLGIGRYTVDLVADRGLFALVGAGVGTEPVAVDLTPVAAAVLVEAADTRDSRTVWETSAWPLAA